MKRYAKRIKNWKRDAQALAANDKTDLTSSDTSSATSHSPANSPTLPAPNSLDDTNSHAHSDTHNDGVRVPPAPADLGEGSLSTHPHMTRHENEVSSSRDESRNEENFDSGNVRTQTTPPASTQEVKRDPATGKRVNVWNVTLSKRQGEALNAPEPFLLYGGAKGGGKSWFLCIWMFIMATRYKGNKLFFCRRRSVDFTNTTLETWRKSIPASFYRINEQKKKIYVLSSKSVIDYGGLDDPMLIQSLNSAEYGQIGVDQAEEVEQDSFSMLRGTLRHRLPDGTCPPFQIRMSANPAQCWLKNDFILNRREGFRFIPALPTDNPYLPSDYVHNLSEAFKHRPALLQAYLHGSWDDLASHDTCIQMEWIRKARGRFVEGKVLKRIVVNDPARYGDDENVIYVMEQVGRFYRKVYEEILEHKSLMDTAGRLSAIRKKHGANLIAVDSIGIGAGIIDALAELGEPYYAINSSSKPTSYSAQEKHYNLRSQMHMDAGRKFADGLVSIDVQEDTILDGQLATTKFEYISTGKFKTESKDDVKRRIGRSPDRGDTFIMGLHALDYADRLDRLRDEESEADRAGRGIPLTEQQHDFSGYSMAQAEEDMGYGYSG